MIIFKIIHKIKILSQLNKFNTFTKLHSTHC